MKKYLIFIIAFCTFLNASILQDAIDRAKDGDIIKLSPGVYEGNIVINKSISIIGDGDNVIITANNKGTVITVNSSYVTLKNLTIIDSGSRHDKIDAALKVSKVKHCEFSNLIIKNTLFGIDLQEVSKTFIANNYIQSKDLSLGLRGDGIRLWYSNDNHIKNNFLYKSRDMVVWYSHGNIIENNKGEHGRYSLHFMYAGKNMVNNNHYKFNSVGIFFMYSKDTTAQNNTVQSSLGNTGMGIGLKEVSNFVIKNNTLLYNARGLYIDRSPFDEGTTNIIENNNILYNSEAMHFHSISENNQIINNNILGNIEDIVSNTRGAKVYKNKWLNNYWDNYQGFDSDKNNIGDNSHKIFSYADKLWLQNPQVKYFYASPIISMLNFLAKLAPFTEPIFLLEDKKPIMEREIR